MKTLVRGASALAFLMLVVSCSGLLKKKEGDAGLEASVAAEVSDAEPAPAPAPASLATNEGDVARFPDETKLADVAAVLQRGYNVREAPPAGSVIVALPKGTAVTQIAQRGGSYLITFDDPKAPGTKLMGWLYKDAFSAVVVDAGPLTCPKGEVLVLGDTQFCAKACGDDSACPPGQACKGQANKILPNGKAGDIMSVCTVFQAHDAGAPTPTVVDAGTKVADAGKPADAGKVDAGKVDAGPAPAPVVDAGPQPTGGDEVPAKGTACPAGYQFVEKTKKCHRPCPGGITARQCSASAFCIKCDKDNKKVCAVDRNECK